MRICPLHLNIKYKLLAGYLVVSMCNFYKPMVKGQVMRGED